MSGPMMGIGRIRTTQIRSGIRCDDCNDLLRDEFAVEIRGRENALYFHSSCAENFARDLAKAAERSFLYV